MFQVPTTSVVVEYRFTNGTVVARTSTDSNGVFEFSDVIPGVYTVVELNSPGFDDVSDSDGGNPNLITVSATFSSRSEYMFVDKHPVTLGFIVDLFVRISIMTNGNFFVDERPSSAPMPTSPNFCPYCQ
jgi:hypothetical protein